MRAALEYRQPFARAAGGVVHRKPVPQTAVVARDADHVFRGGDVQAGHLYRVEDGRRVTLPVERRRRNHDGGLDARIAEIEGARFALHQCTCGQQRRVCAVGVACGDDAMGVEPATHFAGQQLIQREAQVAGAGDRFSVLGGGLQATHHGPQAAAPQRAVASHMLHVKAGPAPCRPVCTEVGIAAARPADAVREHDHRGLARFTGAAR